VLVVGGLGRPAAVFLAGHPDHRRAVGWFLGFLILSLPPDDQGLPLGGPVRTSSRATTFGLLPRRRWPASPC